MSRKNADNASSGATANRASASVEELLLAALDRGDDTLETGRYLVTWKEGAVEEGMQHLKGQGMEVADARDFTDQAVTLESVGEAGAVVFPEIGVALVGGDSAQEYGMNAFMELASDSPIESIDPEYFMFSNEVINAYLGSVSETEEGIPSDYLRGFLRAAEVIANDLRNGKHPAQEEELEPLVLGATWGLIACRVPPSSRGGVGMRVAVLDTGMDLGHPDFAGRTIVSQTFVGQPVQDLLGHGTHMVGTACGPKAPPGSTPRYGIGCRTSIYIGKVLSNSGMGSMAGVLAGMNWAVANRCVAISISLGGPGGPQPAYTAAGYAALNHGCLMMAPAGNSAGAVGSPADSPSIMSVAALDMNLAPASFSSFGKIDIAAPGVNIFSSWPRPIRYKTITGASTAPPHVAGCAALWAEASPSLRGPNLWKKLQTTARHLPYPPSKVGAGLVQAPP